LSVLRGLIVIDDDLIVGVGLGTVKEMAPSLAQ
jgi:hypothetical protein